MFNGKIPILNLKKSEFQSVRYELIDHFSISGVQDKISLKLVKNELIPTAKNGEFILKPRPQEHLPAFPNDVPANEHLTMQIAKQIFKIKAAENALIYFNDGEAAYITKRFDRKNKEKVRMEDFCQIAGLSPENKGKNYKYQYSYQASGEIIKKHSSAYKIEIEKLYKLILFNYVFGNGDAHLKNFSLIESLHGDFILSPAYDLLNTNMHFPNESRMALDLFDDLESEFYLQNGFYGYKDFIKLAEFYEIRSIRAEKIISEFSSKVEKVENLVSLSFLSEVAKEKYLKIYLGRLKAIEL
jgi:serine/threonine-protein kinase HipA